MSRRTSPAHRERMTCLTAQESYSSLEGTIALGPAQARFSLVEAIVIDLHQMVPGRQVGLDLNILASRVTTNGFSSTGSRRPK